ncbi:MAG TPA: ribose 5-phosphate isomerase A [Phycisphaerales bacterium]|jgi:ribose 5-phosphate isomerase A|nr:ribose 5-phosphate isomerase A [Phycisphaerales bacterium]
MSTQPNTPTTSTRSDPLADMAIAEIQSGMIVGLGTGRTASRAVVALAERVREEKLNIRCVPTSHATETLARAHQLPLIDFAMEEEVDYLFDGADEVDPSLRMIKGAGGAMTRERIVAYAAKKRVYMVQEQKMVHRLGERATLPIAVLAFGLASTRASLRRLGLNGVVRRTLDGHLFLTDNGTLIVDVTLDDTSIANMHFEELAEQIDRIPGVLDHGLFLTEADEVLVETNDGRIERLLRPTAETTDSETPRRA